MSSRAIADTSLFIASETGRDLAAPPQDREVGVSIVTIAELETGVLSAADPVSRARRLKTLRAAEHHETLPIDRPVASAFAELVTTMRALGRKRLGQHDAWIAATALVHDAEVWTQDADFEAVPGLRVVRL